MAVSQLNRRDFLRGAKPQTLEVLRPPWAKDLSTCTSCNDCVDACPEEVLKLDGTGLPYVDLSDNGCSFCGDCAEVCEADVFGTTSQPAWQAEVSISESCLLSSGVTCQICTDFCDAEALKFDLSHRPVGRLEVVQEHCTGCGFCIGACPAKAITIKHTEWIPTA